MKIKHIHPIHPSAGKRSESLRDAHRACLALLAAARSRQDPRERKEAKK